MVISDQTYGSDHVYRLHRYRHLAVPPIRMEMTPFSEGVVSYPEKKYD